MRSAALLELGDPRGVGELRRFVEHAERLGHPRGHWAALSRRATLAALTGDLDGAAALAAEALEIGREIGVPDADGCFGTTMVSLIIQGRPAELEPLPADDPIAPLAPLLVALSRPEVDHGPAVRAVPVSALAKVYDLESLVAAAPAYASWGSVEQRRDLDAALRPYAGIHAVIGGCAAYYGPVDYYLGLLAAALGEQARAQEHFRTAETLARRLGAVGWAELAATRHAEAVEDTAASAVWVRQGTTWRLAFAGTEAHLPDAKGLHDIAVLLAAPGQDVHVFTLLGREEPELGADPVLDEEAKRRYRRRIEELQRAIERADHDGDVTASQAASAELEALLRELSSATGPRRSGPTAGRRGGTGAEDSVGSDPRHPGPGRRRPPGARFPPRSFDHARRALQLPAHQASRLADRPLSDQVDVTSWRPIGLAMAMAISMTVPTIRA